MAFSGALTLTDLDDFLSPSQACILPVRQVNKVKGQEDGRDGGETEIHIDSQNNYYEVAIASKPSTAAQPPSLSVLRDPPSASQPTPASSDTSGPLSAVPNGVELNGGTNGVEKAEIEILPAPSSTNGLGSSNGAVGSANGTATAQQLQKAEISLNDCLACSGCVTSTESLLITLQSHLEVQTYIDAHVRYNNSSSIGTSFSGDSTMDQDQSPPTTDARTGVISISPQTLASLSASYYPHASSSSSSSTPSIDPLTTLRLLRRIRYFLRRSENGAWAGVWDTTFARHLSLIEHVREFKQRRAFGKGKSKALDGSKETQLEGQGLPMLASACPGWVCYAEKAHGDLLPFMASTRSSQGIVGGLVKNHWAGRRGRGLEPEEVYHVTVMPCYDKKLEASRSDFYNEQRKTRDVDCVLTTGELEVLLKERGFDPFAVVPGEDDSRPINGEEDCPYPEMLNHPGSSSGSYLQTILDALAAEHSGPTSITTRQIRASDDHVEYILTDTSTGEILFKGAKCYGFRNLQNLVRKIGRETGVKSGKGVGGGAGRLTAAVVARRRAGRASRAGGGAGAETPGTTDSETSRATTPSTTDAEERTLDYVEVMACPGGCVNGGGQMKPVAPASTISQSTKPDKDEEGFDRVWAMEGVEMAKPQVDESMRWSTKAWVSRVEEIYWSGMPTPPTSPSGSPNPSASTSARLALDERKRQQADELAQQIIEEVCQSDGPIDWDSERKRQEFLRTRYRKVESDVTSLAAVKW